MRRQRTRIDGRAERTPLGAGRLFPMPETPSAPAGGPSKPLHPCDFPRGQIAEAGHRDVLPDGPIHGTGCSTCETCVIFNARFPLVHPAVSSYRIPKPT